MAADQHSTQYRDSITDVVGLETICPFLWGDDSPQAQHFAAQWMYANYAAVAYAEFLKHGRGVLAGPFARRDDGMLLDCDSLKDALFETGEMWTATATYLPAADHTFTTAVPQAKIRSLLAPALTSYNPECEVPILLMRNGQPHVFLPNFRTGSYGPRDLFETAANRAGSVEKLIRSGTARPADNRRTADAFAPTFLPLAVG